MEDNWTSLPTEILGVILNKLSITDQYSFDLVCRQWHSAFFEAAQRNLLHPIQSPPWLLMSPESISDPVHSQEGKAVILDRYGSFCYNPVNKKICKNNKMLWRFPPLEEAKCVGSCYDWLAFMDRKCGIYLEKPFRRGDESSSVIPLPPIDTLPCIRSSTILPDGGIEYNYHYFKTGGTDVFFAKNIYTFFVDRLVMSSSPSLFDKKEECIVMMIYSIELQLAVCRLGDTSWTPIHGNLKSNYNLCYSASKNLFHVLCGYSENSFEIWDFSNFSLPNSTCFNKSPKMHMAPSSLNIDEQKLRNLCLKHKYLAELNGKLLLVLRYITEKVDKDGQIVDEDGLDEAYLDTLPYKTFSFDAYEFDWSKQQWLLVHCLGNNGDDDVLFLGMNNAMAFSTRDFPGLQSNSIYFTDDVEYYLWYMTYERKYGGHDLGIFSFNNNNIDHCYYTRDLMMICPTPIWISPNPY